MSLDEDSFIYNHLEKLNETELREIIVNFFISNGHATTRAHVIHGSCEHGIDIVVNVSPDNDLLGRGFNVIIQTKTGKLTLDNWRKNVLCQLLETLYYDINHPNYHDDLSRRILLIVSGSVTEQARNSIKQYNRKHPIPIDLWEIGDIIIQFNKTKFSNEILKTITRVGTPTPIKDKEPEIIGEESEETQLNDRKG